MLQRGQRGRARAGMLVHDEQVASNDAAGAFRPLSASRSFTAPLAGRVLGDGLGEPLERAARRGLLVGLEGQEAVLEAEGLAHGYPPAIYGGHGVLARRPGRASDLR